MLVRLIMFCFLLSSKIDEFDNAGMISNNNMINTEAVVRSRMKWNRSPIGTGILRQLFGYFFLISNFSIELNYCWSTSAFLRQGCILWFIVRFGDYLLLNKVQVFILQGCILCIVLLHCFLSSFLLIFGVSQE